MQSHHGCLVRYFSGAANDAGSLVLGTPRFCRKKSGPFQTWPPDGSPGFGGGRPSSCPSRSVKPGAFFFFWGGKDLRS